MAPFPLVSLHPLPQLADPHSPQALVPWGLCTCGSLCSSPHLAQLPNLLQGFTPPALLCEVSFLVYQLPLPTAHITPSPPDSHHHFSCSLFLSVCIENGTSMRDCPLSGPSSQSLGWCRTRSSCSVNACGRREWRALEWDAGGAWMGVGKGPGSWGDSWGMGGDG